MLKKKSHTHTPKICLLGVRVQYSQSTKAWNIVKFKKFVIINIFPTPNSFTDSQKFLLHKVKKMSSFTFSLIQQYRPNVLIVYLIPDTVLDQDVYQ